jgi:Sec-independent protein translocase protein TatA
MNLKKSWKELRNWMGWIFEFTLVRGFLMFYFVCSFGATCIFKGLMENGTLVKNQLILSVTFLNSIFAFILLAIVIIFGRFKKPQNWRLTIKWAKEFKKEFPENDKIDGLIDLAREKRDGTPLYNYVFNNKALQTLYERKEKLEATLKEVPNELKLIKENIEIFERKIDSY